MRRVWHDPTVPPDSPVAVEIRALSDGESSLVDEWTALERQALEPNVYLSPHFVVPAWRHLDHSPAPLLLVIRDSDGLAGLGVFQRAPASWRVPWPHLQAYSTNFSFLTGLLLHRERAREALSGVLRWMAEDRDAPPALAFPDWRAAGPTASLLRGLSDHGVRWYPFSRRQRAVLQQMASAGDPLATLSGRKKRRLRKARRDLEAKGPVRFEVLRGPAVTSEAVERFLMLESMGWRGEAGTALLSNPRDADFFRAVVTALAPENRVFFAELWCGDEIVASTSNFTAGDMGFAFKIGWDPRFRSETPGVLNEICLVEQFAERLPDLQAIDSGAQPGSYIDDLWPGRVDLERGCLVAGAVMKRYQDVLSMVRRAKHALRPTDLHPS